VACLAGVTGLLLGSTALAGSDSAESSPITVDTRDATDGPVIESVEGLYFSDSRQAFFLTGIAVQEQIEAEVDWGDGQPAGTIVFKRGSITLQSGASATLSYDVGSVPVDQRITVQATSADGEKHSVTRTANFQTVPFPGFLAELALGPASFDVELDGGVVSYVLKAGSDWSIFADDKESLPADDNGDDIPGSTGEPLKWDISMTLSGEVTSGGGYDVTVSYHQEGDGAGWNILGNEVYPTFSGGLHGSFEGSAWSFGGHASVSVGVTLESPPLYIWHLPPIYAEAYLKALVAANGSVTFHSVDGLLWEATIPGDIRFGLIAGIGVDDVAAIEVWGGGGPYWTLQLAPDLQFDEYGIVFECGITFIFLGMDWDIDYERSVDLTAEPQSGASLQSLSEGPAIADVLNVPTKYRFKPVARDYLEREGRRAVSELTAGGSMMALGDATNGVTVLQADGYPYSDPALAVVSNTPSIVWLWDDPGRTAENRTVLVYQSRTSGEWSARMPVWDDGTADFSPALGAWSNGLVAAWQNTGGGRTNGASLEEAFAAQEVAVGVPGAPDWECTNLTANAWLDHSPKLGVAADGQALLCWISNPSNSPSGSATEPNDIMFAAWDGAAWSAPASVATNVGMLLWSTVAFDGSNGVFVCCRDLDDDQGTVANQELYAATYAAPGGWSALSRLTDNAVRDTKPQAVYDAGGGFLLTWYRDGVLMTDTDLALGDAVAAGTMGTSSSAADYRLLTGPNGEIAAVWEGVTPSGHSSPFVINYDRALAAWSQPTELLANSNLLERSFSGAFDADGALHLAYNSVHISTSSNGLPQMGAVDLCVLERTFGRDMAIAEGEIAVTPAYPMPGSTVDVSVAVVNLGEEGVTNVALAVYEGRPAEGGSVIWGTNVVASVLVGGASTNVAFEWTVPADRSECMLVAVVDPGLEVPDDRNRSNNSAERSLLAADIEVRSANAAMGVADERLLSATVVNSGGVPLTNGVVTTFRRGSATGTLVGTTEVFPVTLGTEYGASVAWDLSGLTFTSAYETVWVVADESNTVVEATEDNNAGLMLVMTTLDTDSDGLLDGEELQYGTRIDLPDTDGDGLTDADEIRIHGTGPTIFDTDGDGSGDGHEIAAGTDPFSATDVFKIVSTEGATNYLMCVRWNAKSGTTYRVEMVGSLMAEAWTNAPSGVEPEQQSEQTAVSNGVLRYYDMTPTTPTNRFYRVRIAP